MITRKSTLIAILLCLLAPLAAKAWIGMPMPKLHVEGRYLKDEAGNIVNLHGFGQTYSPWFNEQGSKWSNYDVNACLKYNKQKIDEVLAAGWKMNWVRMHMDPYWSNTPGVSTTGENDISAFDFNRFRTYLNSVFIPMAEYIISKGMYVVMRPPGVCPHDIALNDSYHKYLKRVWGYVSTQTRLTNNPHIMFELANEPVNIMDTDGQYRSNTDGCNKNLSQFFQEIVDLMRGNDCNNILWVPGTGYQSQYAGFAKYPIKGENIGYAVHVYPGWYGSDALDPSQELGGSYGGGFESFAAGWKAQIQPAAEIAPIIVTEMDWAKKSYEASWGKSITGRMFGEGFGGNFKVLADRTGNVSWMLFTGPELIGRFKNVPGTPGNYTFLDDPDACLWPTYFWFKDYAGDPLPAPIKTELVFSPRKSNSIGTTGGNISILTGSRVSAAVVTTYPGFEMCEDHNISISIDDTNIIAWEDNAFKALRPGTTSAKVTYNIGGVEKSIDLTFKSEPFPFEGGHFNPSIYENGTFNPETGVCKTGTYGFAGWKYAAGLDLSDYNYLIAELLTDQNCSLSFRVYDQPNYWTDPHIKDFGNSRRAVIDLNNLKSTENRMLDKSRLHIIGFWSSGSNYFRLKRVLAAQNADGTGSVQEIEIDEADDTPVNVYDIHGRCVRTMVPRSEATIDLTPGIYIVNGEKIAVLPN